MKNLTIDLTHLSVKTPDASFQECLNQSAASLEILKNKTGKGNEFLGWLDLPGIKNTPEYTQLISQAGKIGRFSEVVVVIGIGGSYLGPRAVIEALSHHFKNILPRSTDVPAFLYAGNNLSSTYMSDLLELLDDEAYSLIVISKSGTTTEPAVAFRILKKHLEKKYGKKEAATRIWAITDQDKGALKELADQEAYAQFVVPDNVGGRYSVLSPVGLLPIAAAGISIDEILQGAADMKEYLFGDMAAEENPVLQYVAARNLLYRNGKKTEIMVNYEPSMVMFAEWWKQLFGESEGKEGKGIFPASVNFTADLHSMGQYIQEGERHIFETVLSVRSPRKTMHIPEDEQDLDKLNYIADKSMDFVNKMAEEGTIMAHVDGQVPIIRLQIPELSPYYIGQLIFFFETACAISGYVLGVNPFDQPGVEAYKKNMFALLGKAGYEDLAKQLKK